MCDFFIDESGAEEESKFLFLIGVKTTNSVSSRTLIQEILDDFEAHPSAHLLRSFNDPFIPHFCSDAPIEIQEPLINKLSQLPFQAYICFTSKSSTEFDKEYAWYDKLYRKMLFHLYNSFKEEKLSIYVEQHDSKVTNRNTHLQRVSNLVFEGIPKRSFPHPLINTSEKSELNLILPDYIGGVFSSYINNGLNKKGAFQYRRYHMLSKKIRWICDIDNNRYFTSKHPIEDSKDYV